jgi:2'-5' RNA ligase
MRLFIASPVNLYEHEEIKNDFLPVLEGKWVEEENLHLTWCFLGDLPDAAPVIERMQPLQPLKKEVSIHSIGHFGRPPKILFAKAEADCLYAHAELFKAAKFDLHRFSPHITLCRIKHIKDPKGFKALEHAYLRKTLGILLPQITLYRSTLTPKGPLYTPLFTLG